MSQSFRLQKDDVLTVQNPPHPKESTRKTDPDRVTPPTDNLLARLKNAVIFQDKDFIVLNKPAGLVSQGPSPSISHALPWLRSEIESRPPSLVHRLDKWTSGVLVIARNRQSAIEFSRAMKVGKVQKTYIAILRGQPPGKSGEIDVFLTDDEHFTSKVSRDPAIGKRSLTKYELLCSDVCNGQHLSLVRFYPETGRKHQLRVVAATCLNSPILGDTIYDPESRDQSKYGHLFLHASTLSITTEDYINRWEADLPYYFRELMKQLNWNST